MKKIKVLCKVIHHGDAYGKKDDVIEVPDHIADALVKSKKAVEVKTEKVEKVK